jgi:hypothetical protein
MPTINISAQLSKEDLLQAVQQLSLPELEQFVSDIIAVKAKQQAPHLSKDEAKLLLKINQGVSPNIEQSYQNLIDKRNQEILTESEYQELLKLTDILENHQAQRLEYLVELAQLRQVSLSDLMTQLEIKPIIND